MNETWHCTRKYLINYDICFLCCRFQKNLLLIILGATVVTILVIIQSQDEITRKIFNLDKKEFPREAALDISKVNAEVHVKHFKVSCQKKIIT